jgi:hypothetical protein
MITVPPGAPGAQQPPAPSNTEPQLREDDDLEYFSEDEDVEFEFGNAFEGERGEEREDEDEPEGSAPAPAAPRGLTIGSGRGQIDLPPVPPFEPYNHPAPPHKRTPRLPDTLYRSLREGYHGSTQGAGCIPGCTSDGRNERCAGFQEGDQEVPWDAPALFLKLLFDREVVFNNLKGNTNAYAEMRGAGQPRSRSWRPTSVARLLVFIGLIIYMGVFRSAQLEDYWSRSDEFPRHHIARFMGQKEFEQLKRHFHVSIPCRSLPRRQWIKKLEPLSSILRERFQRHLLPATPVSIDEMMVRFTGRSPHTTLIKGKPIPKGYKIIALCERGYTWDFLYTSRVDSFSGLEAHANTFGFNLSVTSRAVLQMCLSLPSYAYRFVLYCDNY